MDGIPDTDATRSWLALWVTLLELVSIWVRN